MKKQIFIVRGVSNSGKTHTIGHIAEQIVLIYMRKQISTRNIAKLRITIDVIWGTVQSHELMCVITIEYKGHKIVIGICTAGDFAEETAKRVSLLVSHNCDIIICGCKGIADRHDKVYDAILQAANGYAPSAKTTSHSTQEPDSPIKTDICEEVIENLCGIINAELGL